MYRNYDFIMLHDVFAGTPRSKTEGQGTMSNWLGMCAPKTPVSKVMYPSAATKGLALFSEAEIRNCRGMDRIWRKFINEEKERLCKDPAINKWPKKAIEGAANVSWRLRKTLLLYYQAKAAVEATKESDIRQKKKSIGKNIDRMVTAHQGVTRLNLELRELHARSLPSKKETVKKKEEEMEHALSELKLSQEALRKAIDERLKQAEISRSIIEEPLENFKDFGTVNEGDINEILDDINRMEKED